VHVRSHRPLRGHQKTRAKAWYERGEGIARLAHDRTLVEREYPTLGYRIDDEAGSVHLEGTLVYRAACGIPTAVPVRIDFPFDYPRREPRALDVARLFEHSLDRHFATDDGVCCLWLPPKSRWDASDPDTLLTFLDEVVVFFHRQLVYDAGGQAEWPGPQYGHRIDGYEQWIAEEFGDEQALSAFIPILNAHVKVGRNEKCPCGSGRKFKKCHNEKIEQIRRGVAASILQRVFTEKAVETVLPIEALASSEVNEPLAMIVGGSG
jgi:SEC-C motif